MARNNRNRNCNDKRDHAPSKARKADKRVEDKKNEAEFSEPGKLSVLNDISWYTRNPELMAPVSRVAFPYKVGMNLDCGEFTDESGGNLSSVDYTIPGICAIAFEYAFGYSSDSMDPMSIAAAEIWSVIRKEYSGSLDADGPDILMYVIALDQIHAMIAYLKRLYGVVNAYTGENYEFPEMLWNALDPGFSLADAQLGLDQLEYAINTLVDMVNVFAVPNDMDLFHRHRWMNENIYLDEPSLNAQTFIFCPDHFYMIEENTATGTGLKPISVRGNSIKQVFTKCRDMIVALKSWEDALTINGYIKRAYAGSNWYTAELMPHGYRVAPVWVPEVLTQIENLNVIPQYTPVKVRQDPAAHNAVIFEPSVTFPAATTVKYPEPMMNLHTAEVTPADIIIASRLMAYLGESEDNLIYPIVCGTEIVTGLYLFSSSNRFDLSGNGEQVNTHQFLEYASGTGPSDWYAATKSIFLNALADTWNHYPKRWLHFSTTSTSITQPEPVLVGDIANLTIIPRNVLRELHKVCIFSEFNCFGRF